MLDLTDSLCFCMPLCSQRKILQDSVSIPSDDSDFRQKPLEEMTDDEFLMSSLGRTYP